jgi:hypothetical protein
MPGPLNPAVGRSIRYSHQPLPELPIEVMAGIIIASRNENGADVYDLVAFTIAGLSFHTSISFDRNDGPNTWNYVI